MERERERGKETNIIGGYRCREMFGVGGTGGEKSV